MQVINGLFLRIQLKIEGCDVRLKNVSKTTEEAENNLPTPEAESLM